MSEEVKTQDELAKIEIPHLSRRKDFPHVIAIGLRK